MVITDDLALPFGTLRLRKKVLMLVSNGLKNIQEVLQTTRLRKIAFRDFCRFSEGKQVDYVLGKWNEEELKTLLRQNRCFRKSVSIIRFRRNE